MARPDHLPPHGLRRGLTQAASATGDGESFRRVQGRWRGFRIGVHIATNYSLSSFGRSGWHCLPYGVNTRFSAGKQFGNLLRLWHFQYFLAISDRFNLTLARGGVQIS